MFAEFFEKQVFTAPFLANLVSGLLTSLGFLFLILFLFRPRIRISPYIATTTDTFDQDQRECWVVKIVNLSYFSAFDMKVELSRKFSFPGPNNYQNYRVTPLSLKKDQYPYVDPFRPQWWRKGYTDYALRFRTYDNLSEVLRDERNTVEVRIICRHALTGLGSVFVYQYTKYDVKQGIFKSGKDFGIV